ncbi:hypothetical protein BDV96DRAFT_357314 [Lophiotrema nucula]|uniref:Uncharacterized protein n=1 Tax=Lophiotrema nucula TaxID=690887 RepID=A0A6A5YEK9_9PLEO|nr:hypothetical protein BDV96DRAFT_357314 [Lophiotrema nucula]
MVPLSILTPPHQPLRRCPPCRLVEGLDSKLAIGAASSYTVQLAATRVTSSREGQCLPALYAAPRIFKNSVVTVFSCGHISSIAHPLSLPFGTNTHQLHRHGRVMVLGRGYLLVLTTPSLLYLALNTLMISSFQPTMIGPTCRARLHHAAQLRHKFLRFFGRKHALSRRLLLQRPRLSRSGDLNFSSDVDFSGD